MIKKNAFSITLPYMKKLLENWGNAGFNTRPDMYAEELDRIHETLANPRNGSLRLRMFDPSADPIDDLMFSREGNVISIYNNSLGKRGFSLDSNFWSDLDPEPETPKKFSLEGVSLEAFKNYEGSLVVNQNDLKKHFSFFNLILERFITFPGDIYITDGLDKDKAYHVGTPSCVLSPDLKSYKNKNIKDDLPYEFKFKIDDMSNFDRLAISGKLTCVNGLALESSVNFDLFMDENDGGLMNLVDDPSKYIIR